MGERDSMYSPGATGWTIFKNHEEFQEEDVWEVLSDEKNSKNFKLDSSSITSRRLPSAAKMIPKGKKISKTEQPRLVQQSAPVSIPDWSKVHRTRSKKLLRTDMEDGTTGTLDNYWDSDDDDVDGEMMPPHEWVAKKLARTQISSFSVCEGAGRTLKGRDLSRVRNSVLTRTGFIE